MAAVTVLAFPGNVAQYPGRALRRVEQPGQDLQRGGLARSVRSEKTHQLTLLNVKIHLFDGQGLHTFTPEQAAHRACEARLLLIGPKGLREAAYFDNGHRTTVAVPRGVIGRSSRSDGTVRRGFHPPRSGGTSREGLGQPGGLESERVRYSPPDPRRWSPRAQHTLSASGYSVRDRWPSEANSLAALRILPASLSFRLPGPSPTLPLSLRFRRWRRRCCGRGWLGRFPSDGRDRFALRLLEELHLRLSQQVVVF